MCSVWSQQGEQVWFSFAKFWNKETNGTHQHYWAFILKSSLGEESDQQPEDQKPIPEKMRSENDGHRHILLTQKSSLT